MEWAAAIQKAINYMEDHLLENLTCENVARQVHTSAYELHRAFSFLTSMTITSYIRKRRLSLAGRELMETDVSITELAFKYGYETPESFTKSFTRFHGVAPSHARETSARLVLFNPLAIQLTVKGGKSMEYRIVQTKPQKFIALVRSFSNEIINDDSNHDIPDFWDECNSQKLLDPLYRLRPDGKRDLYGLCTPTREGSDTFDYGIGVLLDRDTLPFDPDELRKAGFCFWDVKPGTYAVFDCMGEDGQCISDTWSMFYREFLPQMGYAASQETDYEIYFEKGRPGLMCELWIPICKK